MMRPTASVHRWGGRTAVVVVSLIVMFWAAAVRAELKPMADSELEQITGHGFSSFVLASENGMDVARMHLDIAGATWTEVASMKLGHYNDGWDQSWTSLSLGSDATRLTFRGVSLEAVFSNINDPATRQLQSVTLAYSDVTGQMVADMASFSGYLQGTTYNRANLGPTTVTLDHEPMRITFDATEGIIFHIGN